MRFNRSASRYESVAGIQSRMADRLLGLWSGTEPANILEFGCGTGLLTRRLREKFPEAMLLATDAAPLMLAEARANCETSPLLGFLEQDAEGFAEPSAATRSRTPYDLLASNAMVQWFPDFERHFRFAGELVSPGGCYLVSGFSKSNFPELNSLLGDPPFSYRAFPGHDSETVKVAAVESGWEVMALETWVEGEILPSGWDVLRRIQWLGSARDPRAGGRITRGKLEYLTSEYERRFSESGGVRLTWIPWMALLRR